MTRIAKWRKIPHTPQAVLRTKRNVQQGVSTRSRIIQAIMTSPKTAREIAEELSVSYNAVLRHLKIMEKEKIVTCNHEDGSRWKPTGLGQQPLQQERQNVNVK
ncbi:MAG: winged helix-turn-helix domain-containing protein [Candidatus Jordarchaeales archaeon]|nr:winged helix-turn-helix transcriptional regulator [Candidatus Jordarchaeia archaeon]